MLLQSAKFERVTAGCAARGKSTNESPECSGELVFDVAHYQRFTWDGGASNCLGRQQAGGTSVWRRARNKRRASAEASLSCLSAGDSFGDCAGDSMGLEGTGE